MAARGVDMKQRAQWGMVFGLTAGLVGSGCASSSGGGEIAAAPDLPASTRAEPAGTVQPDVARAGRFYRTGEALFDQGEPAMAVGMWRHALLALPEDARYDEVRHELMMRMGYGLMVAAHEEGNPSHLELAIEMLERYLARHEALFGDDPDHAAEREQIFEIMGEVTVALDDMRDDDDAVLAEADGPVDTHEGEILQPKFERQVQVKRLQQPGVEDPRVREQLRGGFFEPGSAGSLTAAGTFVVTPARPLVRMRRLPRREADGSRARLSAALPVIADVRAELEQCYLAAFARRPHDVVDVTLEFTPSARGTARRPEIRHGSLIDPLGDACLLEALEGSTALPNTGRDERLVVELRFFWQGARIASEIDGTSPDMFPNPDRGAPRPSDYRGGDASLDASRRQFNGTGTRANPGRQGGSTPPPF